MLCRHSIDTIRKMARFYTVKVGFTNCFLFRLDEGYLLLDTGVPGKSDLLWNFLRERSIDPREIKLTVLTHAHFDHAGNAFEVKARTGAELLAHKCEIEGLMKGKTDIPPGLGTWGGFLSRFLSHLDMGFNPVDPDIYIEGDFDLSGFGLSGRILHTPGHTAGSITLLLDSGEAFVGDLLMSGPPLRLSPGLPIFAESREEVLNSLRKLRSMGAKMFYPAHGKPFPSSAVDHLIGVP